MLAAQAHRAQAAVERSAVRPGHPVHRIRRQAHPATGGTAHPCGQADRPGRRAHRGAGPCTGGARARGVHASRRSEQAQDVARQCALHARPQLPPGNLGLKTYLARRRQPLLDVLDHVHGRRPPKPRHQSPRQRVAVPDCSGRLGSRDGNRLGCVIAQVCIADLDLHGLAVVVHRVVDDADERLVHPFSDLHPVRGFRELEVVRSFRGGAARDALEVVTHIVVMLLREPDFEIEPPVVLVPGRVLDPNGQTRHVGRGGRRRGDRSRRLGGRDVDGRYFSAALIVQARVTEPYHHRLPVVGDRVLNEREAPSARSSLPPE